MRAALVSAIMVVGACGVSSRPVPPPAAAEVERAGGWPDGISLTELWTLGELPPAKDSVVIGVEKDGRLSADGEERTLASLTALLRAQAVGTTEPVEGRNAVLAIDEDVPWRVTAWTLQACAAARVHRIFFAARTHGDEVPGGFAVFLPSDRGEPFPREPPDVQLAVVRIRSGDEHARDPWRLSLPVGDLVADPGPLSIEVDASGEVPTGAVLAVLDVLHRSGADDVRLVGTPPPAGRTTRAEVAAAAGRTRSWGVELVAHELAQEAPSPPPGARVRGYAGFTGPLATVPEELPELVPPVEIRDGEGR